MNSYPEIIGHRGARGLFPENTVDGFVNTVKMGIRSLELDIVISKDEKIVVSHEPWMHHKICSEPGGERVKLKQQHNIYEMSYADIRQYDCGKRGNRDFPGQHPAPAHKPLLSEAIFSVDEFTKKNALPPAEYIIEIKSHEKTDGLFHPAPTRYAQLVHDEMKRLNIYERIVIKSFDIRPLQHLHTLDPSLRIGLLIANLASVEKNVKSLGFVPYTYNPSHRILKQKTVDTAHSMEMKVMVWTVNDADEMKQAAAMGVDGIITDHPEIAIKAFKKDI